MRPWRVKDANSKPIEVVTFGDVDAEKHRDSEDEILSRFVEELVIWLIVLVSRTQPSGPLCLWQCLGNAMFPNSIQNNRISEYILGKAIALVGLDET